MTTDKSRAEFETWIEKDFLAGMDSAGEFDEARNCYVSFPVHMAYKGWQASRRQALEAGFEKGWITAAEWAFRVDLITDIGSLAYDKDRDEALRSLEGNLTGGIL